MFKGVQIVVGELFSDAPSDRQVDHFAWRLVHRKNRPFLLLPEKSSGASENFKLYSAHRPLARLWRAIFPLVLRTPVALFFPRVTIPVAPDSEFVQFLRQQSGLSADSLQPPPIKFGGVAGKMSRLVLLLCDAGSHPIRVIKVGLDAGGRAATSREADLLVSLPKDLIGCTGISGRFQSDKLCAFATDYFPGASLDNDVGIEKLFHCWLNDTPPEPLKNLASWHALEAVAQAVQLPEWPVLRAALADQTVRTTLYHGDFAPWNVRMTNLENIRAFDWERGHLKGIPAWDWFHFIVQTSILVKRYSPARVAAELEQLIQSPRFKQYASEAGISHLVKPLLLAYLLDQKLVAKPREGWQQTDQLFRLLWLHWRLAGDPVQPALEAGSDLRKSPVRQIKLALAQISNLFWEPALSPISRPALGVALRRHWRAMILAFGWLGGISVVQSVADFHFGFSPFYLVPCVLLAATTDRRLAFLAALVGALIGPLIQYFQVGSISSSVTTWNVIMRFAVYGIFVILLDNLRQRKRLHRLRSLPSQPEGEPAFLDNWAVVLATGIYSLVVMGLDAVTDPNLVFLPLYALPCMVLTISLGWRWGTAAALFVAVAGPLLQLPAAAGYLHWNIGFWNGFMRLIIFQTIVLLVEQVRRDNVLFVRKTFDTEFFSPVTGPGSAKKFG